MVFINKDDINYVLKLFDENNNDEYCDIIQNDK